MGKDPGLASEISGKQEMLVGPGPASLCPFDLRCFPLRVWKQVVHGFGTVRVGEGPLSFTASPATYGPAAVPAASPSVTAPRAVAGLLHA